MKATHALAPLLLTTAGLIGGHAATRPAVDSLQEDKSSLEEKVEVLQGKVAKLTERLDQVAADGAEQREATEKTVDYLRRQAAQAEKLLGTIDESERSGFTAGINPRSREVLLAGWREAAREAQVGLPGDDEDPTPQRP